MSRQTDLEKKYSNLLLEDALANLLNDDKKVAEIIDMFEYYGVERLGKGFDKLNMPSQMYLVGGLLQRFTDGLPEGAGFTEVKVENSGWHYLLVRKDSGYQPEVDALIAATEEDE